MNESEILEAIRQNERERRPLREERDQLNIRIEVIDNLLTELRTKSMRLWRELELRLSELEASTAPVHP